MKKILCPIDFSKSSLNGLEYAAQLAKKLNAALFLLYVRTSIWPEAIQLERESKQSDDEIRAKLELCCQEIFKAFGISSRYHVDSTILTLEESVAANTADVDLVVMGTNGADTLYQYLFGSNAFHVIEKSKCPVLVVPEDFVFRPIKLVVYAHDPRTNPLFLMDQLKSLVLAIHASVHVLHIAEDKPSDYVNHELEILGNALQARAPKGIAWGISSQYGSEASMALNHFATENKVDLLALSFHHRTWMENILKENTIKKLSAVADHPIFVFWH